MLINDYHFVDYLSLIKYCHQYRHHGYHIYYCTHLTRNLLQKFMFPLLSHVGAVSFLRLNFFSDLHENSRLSSI